MTPTTDTFLIREGIHRGGMGLVWRAGQDTFAQRTRVHLFEPELAVLPALLAHLRDEARRGAKRNATAVIDRVARRPLVVMERVEGVSLAGLLRTRGRFSLDRALEVVGQILGALGAVHDAGMIHADLQPGSVVVDPCVDTDVVSLVDFGGTNDARGSRATGYLAPEVIAGGAPTVASDIYAAGVILYELLAGVPPFRGDTAVDTMTLQLHRTPTPLSLIQPPLQVPAAVERVCMRAISRSPSMRFHTARSFAAALHAAATAPDQPHHDHVESLRAALAAAIARGSGDAIVNRTVDLAIALDHNDRHPEAIHALEQALELIVWEGGEPEQRLRLALALLHKRD